MQRKILSGIVLLSLCGCTSMNNTESGALGGGIIGGVLGTVVGAACHAPLAGAAIGAAAGAGTGALVGNAEDHAEKKQAERQYAAAAQAAATAPTLPDIVSMTQHGVSDSNIIIQVRNSGAVYQLNAQDMNYLQDNRVSPQVIAELQATSARVYARPVAVYDPYYAPPPPVVGVGFVGGYRRW